MDDPFHLLDPKPPFQDDLTALLKENGYSAASGKAMPRLILMPSVSAIQGGFVYGVIAYLQRPGETGGIRSSAATAIRSRQDLSSGVRQAVVDTATTLLLRLKSNPPSPLRTLSFPDAPRPGGGYAFVPIENLRTRVQPNPPRLSGYARSRGVRGLVKVSIIIGPDGLPQRADLVSGPPELAFTALAYVFQCVYEPDKASRTLRTELTIPFGKLGPADLDQPGMGIQRTQMIPAEMVKSGASMMPEP